MKNLSSKPWGLFVCVLLTLLLSYSSSTVVFANQQPPNRSRAGIQAEIKQTETPAPFEENSSGQFPAPNGIADVNTQGPAATEGSNPYRYLGTLVPSGTLANAYGIARDRNGRIFVTNGAKNKIGIFDAQTFQSLGLLQSAPAPKLNLPYGIGSDSDNNLYVADFNNNAVKKFTFDSATNSYTRTQWKNFNHPTGIWVDT